MTPITNIEAVCLSCEEIFYVREDVFKDPYTCEECRIDVQLDKNALEANNGLLVQAARSVLIFWHAGAMKSCSDEVQEALSQLDDEVVSLNPQDSCQSCYGTKGGIPGNENVVDGQVLCDYCHAEKMKKTSDSTWEWDGDCTRCNRTLTWEGVPPETEEEAICDDCTRAQLVDLRKSLRAFEGRYGHMCRGTIEYDALLKAAGVEPFDQKEPPPVNPTPVRAFENMIEWRDGVCWYSGRIVHKAIISAVEDERKRLGISHDSIPSMPDFTGCKPKEVRTPNCTDCSVVYGLCNPCDPSVQLRPDGHVRCDHCEAKKSKKPKSPK